MIGLSIGLACCILIILYVIDEISFDKFHSNSSRIFRVNTSIYTSQEGVEHKMSISSPPVGPAIKNEIPGVKDYVRIVTGNAIIRSNGDIINENISFCDKSFFSVFSFPLLHGDAGSALNEINSIVLTKDKAKKYFGTSDVIGRQLSLKMDSTFENFVVTGVIENPPQNSSIQYDILLPFEYHENHSAIKHGWLGFYMNTYLLLQPGTSAARVNAQIPKLVEKYIGEKIKEQEKASKSKIAITFFLQPLKDIHLDTSMDVNDAAFNSKPFYSYILSGIALFILIISCINFVNLNVGLSLKRSKEIGVRKVVGGTRKQLILQFICESFLLCSFAFLLSLFLVKVSLPVFNELSNKKLNLLYALDDPRLLAAFFVLLLLTSLAAGFYPAFVASRFKPVSVLYSRQPKSGKNLVSKFLVIIQFALAIFLVTSTIVFQSQFNFLTTKDLGFDDKNVVRVVLPHRNKSASVFVNEIRKNNNIQIVALRSNGLSITGAKTGDKTFATSFARINENFIPVLHISLIKGRNFSTDFLSDTSDAVIINEAFAKEAGWHDPIGKTFLAGDDQTKTLTVVGLVKDYNFQSLHDKVMPLLLHNGAMEQNLDETLIKVNQAEIPRTLAFIENNFKKLFLLTPYRYEFLEEVNALQYNSERKWKQIIFYSSILSIIISCLGLIGLTSLSIIRRRKEIGIRKVMGASISVITMLVCKEFLRLVIVAFLISIPFAWYTSSKWLQNFAYRINISWWVFALAGLSAIVIALITISFQSVKAAISNPVKSLRTE